MKLFLTSLIFSLSCLMVSAQQDRFIYLQTENNQPFFVKLNNKIFTSFPLGYLIIPRMDDGLYNLVITFPESAKEQAFNCSIDQKDIGFIIKNVGEQRWQLLNVQTGNAIVPAEVFNQNTPEYEIETDPFSIMLANAVHDSTILRKDAKDVVTVKTELPANTDSSLALQTNRVTKADSSADISLANPSKANETVQTDTIQSAKKDIVINTTDSSLKDSVVTDVAKVILKPEINVVKDTAQIISNNESNIIKPDSIATAGPVTNDGGKEKTDRSLLIEGRDSVKTDVPANDVAIANPGRKKRAKKNDNTFEDSVITKNDVVKEVNNRNIESKDSNQSVEPIKDMVLSKSVIKRRSRKNGKEGIELVYVDDNGETKDTIRILIPAEKKIKEEEKITAPVVTIPVEVKVTEPKDKKNYKITREEKEIIKEANRDSVLVSTMINSDCKNFATDDDFFKIRKKMVAENTDGDMIRAAKKIFKTRCFTTEQIKNLSVLFLKDESRFLFFETAYAFVSDSDLYFSLEKQLTDDIYISRFRAMIHK